MKMKNCSSLCSLCLTVLAAATGVLPLRELRYALFTSGPQGGFDSSGAIPAVELAEKEIFKDSSVLEGYKLLHTTIKDTQCDRTLSLDLYFASVAQATPPVLGLLGCGCSEASEPVAEIIHHWNISQVAYGSSAITLSNRQRFVNFFRTYPSDESLAQAILPFLQFYDWKRIIFITQEQNLFISMYQSLSPELEKNNITTKNRMVSNSIPMVISSLKQSDFFFPDDDIRVILINAYSNIARVIMCEALRFHDIVGYPRYVWITYAWYKDEWWMSAVNDEPIRCDNEEFAQLLTLSIAIQVVPVTDDLDADTEVGLTANEFFEQYTEQLNMAATQENSYTFSFAAPIAYDAVWSFALALNRTTTILGWPKDRIVQETNCEDDGKDLEGFRLEDFTYNHSFVGCIVRWSLAQTDFAGITGQVTFNENGTRQRNKITMMQYQDTGEGIARVVFGYTDRLNNFTFEYINSQGKDTVFPDGIPSDGTPIHVVISYHLALVIIYEFLASLGLIFTTGCFFFNLLYRNRKIVRLTSPNLNYFIIFGGFFMYGSVFVRLIPSTDAYVNYLRCHIQVLTGTLGYCLAYGTILAKMGRIYHIFNNPTAQKKKGLTDWYMAVIVVVITGVGFLMAVLGWAIPLLRAIPTLEPDVERKPGRDVRGVKVIYLVWQCTAKNNSNIINISIFVYEAILQFIGVILAYRTRKVKIKVLNDYRYIISAIYISTVALISAAAVTVVLGALINTNELVFSGVVIFATTTFLCLTFIPKMVSLYRDPYGERIFTEEPTMTTEVIVGRPDGLVIRNNDERVSQLEAQVKELEEELLQEKTGKDDSITCTNPSLRLTSKLIFTEMRQVCSIDKQEYDSITPFPNASYVCNNRENSIPGTVCSAPVKAEQITN